MIQDLRPYTYISTMVVEVLGMQMKLHPRPIKDSIGKVTIDPRLVRSWKENLMSNDMPQHKNLAQGKPLAGKPSGPPTEDKYAKGGAVKGHGSHGHKGMPSSMPGKGKR